MAAGLVSRTDAAFGRESKGAPETKSVSEEGAGEGEQETGGEENAHPASRTTAAPKVEPATGTTRAPAVEKGLLIYCEMVLWVHTLKYSSLERLQYIDIHTDAHTYIYKHNKYLCVNIYI